MNTGVIFLARALHDIFTVLWMGGLLVSTLSFMPAVRQVFADDPKKSAQVMVAFNKRHSKWVLSGIVVLIISGLILGRNNPQFTGLFSFANPYSTVTAIKHLIVIALIVVSLMTNRLKKQEQSGEPQHQKQKTLQLISTILAFAILIVSALQASLA